MTNWTSRGLRAETDGFVSLHCPARLLYEALLFVHPLLVEGHPHAMPDYSPRTYRLNILGGVKRTDVILEDKNKSTQNTIILFALDF